MVVKLTSLVELEMVWVFRLRGKVVEFKVGKAGMPVMVGFALAGELPAGLPSELVLVETLSELLVMNGGASIGVGSVVKVSGKDCAGVAEAGKGVEVV